MPSSSSCSAAMILQARAKSSSMWRRCKDCRLVDRMRERLRDALPERERPEICWRKFNTFGRPKMEGFGSEAFEAEEDGEVEEDPLGESESPAATASSSLPSQTQTSMMTEYSAGTGPITIVAHTVGGQALTINGCPENVTLRHVVDVLQKMLNARADEIKLLIDGDLVSGHNEPRLDEKAKRVGLTEEGCNLMVIRTQSLDCLNEKLAKAIEGGQDQEARELLDSGAGFDSEGKPVTAMGSSMLHLAVRARLEGLALLLISSGADIHATNENGRKPLAVAAMKGLGRVIVALLDAGADPYHEDKFKWSAIRHAENPNAWKAAAADSSLEGLTRLTALGSGN